MERDKEKEAQGNKEIKKQKKEKEIREKEDKHTGGKVIIFIFN
jgi:hypothetical protein